VSLCYGNKILTKSTNIVVPNFSLSPTCGLCVCTLLRPVLLFLHAVNRFLKMEFFGPYLFNILLMILWIIVNVIYMPQRQTRIVVD
jgi:hypothetical protein